MLHWRHHGRRAREEVLAQIRAALMEEQRLRKELGIEPFQPVILPAARYPVGAEILLAGDHVGRVDPHPFRIERSTDDLRWIHPQPGDDEVH